MVSEGDAIMSRYLPSKGWATDRGRTGEGGGGECCERVTVMCKSSVHQPALNNDLIRYTSCAPAMIFVTDATVRAQRAGLWLVE